MFWWGVRDICYIGITMNKIDWAALRFPPLNLWNIWPTDSMCRIHMEGLDETLWDNDYDTEVI